MFLILSEMFPGAPRKGGKRLNAREGVPGKQRPPLRRQVFQAWAR
jgi:hypothetical protein